jgi:hypothetical protein
LRRHLTSGNQLWAFFWIQKEHLTSLLFDCSGQRFWVSSTIVHWIRDTMEGPRPWRLSVIIYEGCGVYSCLQRDALSPLLWCLTVDDLITRLNGGSVYTQSNTDIVCLLAVGKFSNTVSELIQRALHTVEVWCNEDGLSVKPDKTDCVIFMRKMKIPGFFTPVFLELPCTVLCQKSISE